MLHLHQFAIDFHGASGLFVGFRFFEFSGQGGLLLFELLDFLFQLVDGLLLVSAPTRTRLTFLGFMLPPHVLAAFVKRFPDHPLPGRLADWAIFEAEIPTTFEGMYCFWCARA